VNDVTPIQSSRIDISSPHRSTARPLQQTPALVSVFDHIKPTVMVKKGGGRACHHDKKRPPLALQDYNECLRAYCPEASGTDLGMRHLDYLSQSL
jgi:hypothetical protein